MKSHKQKLITLLVASFAALVLTTGASAQQKATAVSTTSSGGSILPVADLRQGMKGIARTVFAGSAPEEFGIEIIGVLPGFTGPRQSTIIAKLSGPNVDKTGVFAGMSGSPVFIDGRLVGAIAYSFPFAKEPICGITPIKQMIDIFAQANERPKSNEARAFSFSGSARSRKPMLPK